MSEHSAKKVRDPPRLETTDDLEALLSRRPTLDTDVMDFFLVANWNYGLNESYLRAQQPVKAELRARRKARQRELTRSQKAKEHLFGNAVAHLYWDKEIRTIRDLKEYVETHGMKAHLMGPEGLATFNRTLGDYGLPPIRLGKMYDRRREMAAGLKPIQTTD